MTLQLFISGELKIPILKLAATEIVSGISGESESRLRELFDKAVASAPCILFIDEIDAITQRRDQTNKGTPADENRLFLSRLRECWSNLLLQFSENQLKEKLTKSWRIFKVFMARCYKSLEKLLSVKTALTCYNEVIETDNDLFIPSHRVSAADEEQNVFLP